MFWKKKTSKLSGKGSDSSDYGMQEKPSRKQKEYYSTLEIQVKVKLVI